MCTAAAGAAAPKRKRATRESTGGASKKGKGKDDSVKWKTLVHSGVLFPPEYEPHGVQMLYDGRPIDLTPEQEEVACPTRLMRVFLALADVRSGSTVCTLRDVCCIAV